MKEERIATTIRFPRDLIERAKALTNGSGSFNDLVVKAVEAEVWKREFRGLRKEIDQHREAIYRKHGLLSDSTPLIRELREGIGRRD